jgi:hypothetical protein
MEMKQTVFDYNTGNRMGIWNCLQMIQTASEEHTVVKGTNGRMKLFWMVHTVPEQDTVMTGSNGLFGMIQTVP